MREVKIFFIVGFICIFCQKAINNCRVIIPIPDINMELRFDNVEYCGDQIVQIEIITRIFSGLGGLEDCAIGNGYAYLLHSIVYNFEVEFIDNGDPTNNATYSFSHAVDQAYVNNASPTSLGNGFEILFTDTDWACSSCSSATDDSIYNNTNYYPYIGECDTETPRRPDLDPVTFTNLPNFTSILTFTVPSNFVGPGSISFNGTNENVYTVNSTNAFGFPFYYADVMPQTIQAEGNIGPGGGTGLDLDVGGPDDCSPLALTLIKFNAEKSANNALINWSITSDENFNIEVEHSLNSTNFSSIENISYEGLLNDHIIEDNYTHTTPSPGFNYYRLKIIRENGSIEYSDVVSLEFDGDLRSEDMKVYPNPVRDVVTVENGRSFDEVEIYTIQGRLVRKVRCEQTNMYQIGTADLDPGKYFIRITGMDMIETTSFIKL